MKTIELTDEEFYTLLVDFQILGQGISADSEDYTKAHIHSTNLIIEAVKRQYEK